MEDTQRPVILAVDDLPRNLELLAQVLDREGYRVLLAADGAQTLAMAVKEKPDLILLDIQMPGQDGLEVCRQLKTDSATQDIPVIFLTVHSKPAEILTGFKAGAVDYVTKPFPIPELLARVQVHVALRRARLEIRTLRGILPTCAHCKKIRDEHGTWHVIEVYISERTEAQFSHGLCPDCIPTYFPDFQTNVSARSRSDDLAGKTEAPPE